MVVCPACTFVNSPARTICEMCESELKKEAVMERFKIAADNSCLFNAVGYICEGALREDMATELRGLVAGIVSTDSEKYNEGVLGRPVSDYVAYIQRPEIWGGGLELEVLSAMFGVQFIAVDILTKKHFVFGPPTGQCGYLLFSGTHYDAIVRRNPDGSVQTRFPMDDALALSGALAIAEEAHKRGAFTDLNKFTLLCLDCHQGVVGQVEAVEHAKATGHVNFGEYAAPRK